MSSLDPERLRAATFADRVEFRPSVGSTNDLARDLAPRLPREEVVLILADEQTAGRGRGGNRWWTGPGSLAASLLADLRRWNIEPRYSAMTPLAAAVAAVESIRTLLGDHLVGVHWPNDVFASGRKLAGVLVEPLPCGRHVIGLGLNVNNTSSGAPAELRSRITSMRELGGRDFDRTELMITVLAQLDCALEQLGASRHELGRRANDLCLQRGRTLLIRTATATESGTCEGIADDGALVLSTATGMRHIYAGVVEQTD